MYVLLLQLPIVLLQQHRFPFISARCRKCWTACDCARVLTGLLIS
jgi:hypothetical protein